MNKEVIYLVSSDGHSDTIILDQFATNKEEIENIITQHVGYLFGDIIRTINKKTIPTAI